MESILKDSPSGESSSAAESPDESSIESDEEMTIFNEFLKAVEDNNLEVTSNFLNSTLGNLNVNILLRALNIALNKENIEIYDQIATAIRNVAPENKEFRTSIKKREEYAEIVGNFHLEVQKENQKEAKASIKIFAKNEKLRLCYGKNKKGEMVSALEHAIDCKKFKTFSYLRAEGFYTNNNKTLLEKMEKLDEDQRVEIRNENLKNAQEFPDAFFLSKCKFDAHSPVKKEDVQQMLCDLKANKNLKIFLEVASQVDFTVVFDFANKSVAMMAPQKPGESERTMGLIDFEKNELFVGRDFSKHERYGTFVHELSHMLLNLLYDNSFLPYCEGDTKKEEEWMKILNHERVKFVNAWEDNNLDTIDPIFWWVFYCYSGDWEQQAELAVRPNHVMARYYDDEAKIQLIREDHSSCFKYMDCFFKDLEIPNVLRFVKLNKDFGIIKRIKESNLKVSHNNVEELENFQAKTVLTSNVPKIALSKLYQKIEKLYENQLEIRAKNIFVDVDKLKQIHLEKELVSLLEDSDVDRIIFDATDSKSIDDFLDYLRKFITPEEWEIKKNQINSKDLHKLYCNIGKTKFVVICNEDNALNFKEKLNYHRLFVKSYYDDLTKESKDSILKTKVNFQGEDKMVSDFLNSVSDECLPLLTQSEKIAINVNSNLKLQGKIISRILKSQQLELNIDDFLKTFQDNQAIVISSCAGSGKTTLLLKIYEELLIKYLEPKHWISFIGLRDYTDKLSKELSEDKTLTNFHEVFIKLTELNPLESQIFTEKFSKGQVKILFDAFDEISPICKEQTLRLFSLFMEQKQNLILVTTREHLEQNLEETLKVECVKIKPLNNDDQRDFLCNFWCNSNEDKKFIEQCANELIAKIAEMVSGHENLIGIPIIIQSVAKIYENQIDAEFSQRIKDLKFSIVYDKIISDCLNFLNKNHPTNVLKDEGPPLVLKCLAVKYLFGKNLTEELHLSYNAKDWPLEEVSRYGIISYKNDKEVFFNHQTYAEHLVSEILKYNFHKSKRLSKAYLKLLKKILEAEKYRISQIILDELLEDFNGKNILIFHDENDEEVFDLIVKRKLPNLFKICLESNLNTICNINEKVEESLKLMANNERTFEKFLTIATKYYGHNFYQDFLLTTRRVVNERKTVLQCLIEVLSEKCLEIFLLFNQSCQSEKQTVLHFCTEDFDLLKEAMEVIKTKLSLKFKAELIQAQNEHDQNILMLSILKNEKSFDLILDFVEDNMEKAEKEKLLTTLDKNGENILHYAALNLKSIETFHKLQQSICVEDLKKLLSHKNNANETILHKAILNKHNPEIFNHTLLLAKTECHEGVKSLIQEKISDGVRKEETVLSIAAANSESNTLSLLLENISNTFEEREIFEILKMTKSSKGRNLLSLAAVNKNKGIIEPLWNYCEKYLKEDIIQILNDKDDDDNNVLHVAAAFAKFESVFEDLWLKISKHFKNNQKKLDDYSKQNGYQNRNLLLQAVSHANENTFFFIFKKFPNFNKDENFIKCFAEFSSFAMIRFVLDELSSEDQVKLMELKSGKYGMRFKEINGAFKGIANILSKLENDETIIRNRKKKMKKDVNEIFLKPLLKLIKDTFGEESLKYKMAGQKYVLLSSTQKDILHFELLNLFNYDVSSKVLGEIFQCVILNKRFELFLTFLNASDSSNVEDKKIEKLIKIDTARNFLQDSVESENVEVLRLLLSHVQKFPEYLNFKLYEEAVKTSKGKSSVKIFNMLKNYSRLFPESENLFSKKDDLLFIDELHEDIKDGNLANVKKFVEKYKDQKLCYGNEGVCALEYAIDCTQFKIYSFLRANGFYTDKSKELEEKIERLSKNDHEKIRTENLKYVKSIPCAALLSKCQFDVNSQLASDEVYEMLKEFSKIDELNPFLQIAAESDIKIIFDFSNESVKNMDPGSDELTMGQTYSAQKLIFIGGDRDKLSRYGTFMHELTQQVMYLIYENNCLPYCDGDQKREEMWNQIYSIEYEKYITDWKNLDPIIRWVFQCYHEGYSQRATLAVRPNQIMARYIENPEKVEKLRETHAELFDYAKNVVLSDLLIPNLYRLITINNNFEVIKNILKSKVNDRELIALPKQNMKQLALTSNNPKSTLVRLYNKIKITSQNKLHVKCRNIFVNVQKLKRLGNELESLLETSELDRVIFDASDSIDAEKVLEFLKDFSCEVQIIVVCDEVNGRKFVEELAFEQIED